MNAIQCVSYWTNLYYVQQNIPSCKQEMFSARNYPFINTNKSERL